MSCITITCDCSLTFCWLTCMKQQIHILLLYFCWYLSYLTKVTRQTYHRLLSRVSRRENTQNCSVLYCVRVYDSCAQWYAHTCEQLINLRVGLGFVCLFRFTIRVFYVTLDDFISVFLAFVVLDFSTKPRAWLGRMSVKWFRCWFRRDINCLCAYLTFFITFFLLYFLPTLLLSFLMLFILLIYFLTGLLYDLSIYSTQNRPVPFRGRMS